jgi:cytochrome bd-type quinol oxidase subunit 2
MLKKYLPLIVFLPLLVGIFWSTLFSSSMTLFFIIATILFSLAISIYFILEKHRGAENRRQKITRDVLILIVMFTSVILIGGWAGLWVGQQAEGRFGAVVGVMAALAVSFAAGYLVRKGMRKLIGS